MHAPNTLAFPLSVAVLINCSGESQLLMLWWLFIVWKISAVYPLVVVYSMESLSCLLFGMQ